MCEPDPAFTRAHSSSTSPTSLASSATATWPQRRRLRRSQARLRLFRCHQNQRWAEETPSERWSPARRLAAPPNPRTRRMTEPRSPWMRHVHLSRRQSSSAVVQEVPSACWGKDKPEVRGMLQATVLARARCGRRGGKLLLLTLLGVRAYPAPRTARPRSPPLQQKRSQGRNCSSTSLQRQTRPKTGGLPSRA